MSEMQGEAWRLERAGSLGASSLHEALAKTAKGWGASRAQIMSRLAVERLTGKPVERFENQAMRDGTAREPEAADAYAFRYDVDLAECGLFKHPAINWTHASPDRLLGDTGLVEIKCPTHATHLESLLGAPIPQKYQLQIAWQLCCTGRSYCDFVSYHPDFPEAMRLHVQRVHRDDKLIADLEAQVREFLHELQLKLVELTARYGAPVKEAA